MSDGEEVFRDNPPGLRERLRGLRAGIAGCGGIGSNTALLLARAGVGELLLVDHDRVEERNLNRQNYFRETWGCEGEPWQARSENRRGNPLKAVDTEIRLRNAADLFSGCDILVEALDLDGPRRCCLPPGSLDCPGSVVACSGLAGLEDPDGIGWTAGCADRGGRRLLGTERRNPFRRVCLVASLMALEAVRILAEREAPANPAPIRVRMVWN